MSGPLMLIVGVVYAYIAAEQYWRGNPGIALAFFGYAISNIGLSFTAK